MAAVTFAIVSEQYAKIHQAYSRYQQTAEYDRRNTAKEIERSCIGLQPPDFAHCIANRIEANYNKQSTNQDLQAQQDMAFWALCAFAAACVTVVVTIVGIFYVRQTLEANRDAVSTAGKAIDETRRTHITEQRPWIAVWAVRPNKGIVSNDVIDVRLWVQFKNFGKTPALNVRTHSVPYSRQTGSSKMVNSFIMALKQSTENLPGKTLVPGDWFEIGYGPFYIGKNILAEETKVYKDHISMRFSVGATYKSLLSDEVYHSARSYLVMVKKLDEGEVAADLIEFYEMDGGSDFS